MLRTTFSPFYTARSVRSYDPAPVPAFVKRFFAKKSAGTNTGGGIPGDIVYHMKNIGVQVAHNRKLFEDVSLAFLRGAKIGVLGNNGSGKSTLMKVIAGVQKDFDGETWLQPGLRLGYLAQEPELDPSKNVRENIMDGLKESQELLRKFDEVSLKMGEPDADFDKLMDEQAKLQERIDDLNCWDLSHEVDIVMNHLRVPPGDSDVTVLSGGEKRRVALCRLLLEKPDILLLDEPTNHLDATSVAWLENFLQSYKGTVVSITHDRYFLDNVAGWILEIERGATYAYEGNYTSWLQQKSNRLNMERKKEAVQAKQMKSELEWIMRHQGMSKGSKAREKSIEPSQAELSKTRAQLGKLEEGRIVIPPGPRLGNKVISVKNLTKSFDGRLLLDNVSFELNPRSVVGVIGPNGVGKSTLFKLIGGSIQADEGEIIMGQSVKLGLVSQTREELNPKHSVYQAISNETDEIDVGGDIMSARAYLASFNIKGAAQEKKVSSLSGGERNRVHLAKELMRGNNVLMLDEPTNDLDVTTLRSLENALQDFEGVSIVISHDRWFLNRICTHIIAFEGDGKVVFFHGNYEEYVDVRGFAEIES